MYTNKMEDTCDFEADSKPGVCDVCSVGKAQYTCPGCDTKSCSLGCVKEHKEDISCTGERDKTNYIPISKFSNLNLLSDYRFLEDISRTVDRCKTNPLKKSTRHNRFLPYFLHKLKSAAGERKTNLQFLPQHFTRHKENTTYFNTKTGIIQWRVNLVFPQADNIQIIEERCDENDRLSLIVSKYVEVATCPESYKSQLKFYHAAGVAGLEVLLKAEGMTLPSYFLLDMFSSLKDNFANRVIIENPVIYVILKGHKDEYHLQDPEVELKPNLNASGGRFTPFSYFDTVSYTNQKISKEGKHTMDSIHSSAKELKKYFSTNEDVQSDEEEEEIVPKTSKHFSIPNYEDL